jgi:glycosyltransferase involved in cell wall biosynthesis
VSSVPADGPRLKIAFIGQKGIPAHFGGIEFHVDELSRRLVQRGHRVSVYVRDWYTPGVLTDYEGIDLVHTPTIRSKHLDAFLHSLTSSAHALGQHYDIVHYHALGPSFFAWIPRLRSPKVVVTIHALDWQRPKWGRAARAFLRMTERTALYLPHACIAVSRALQAYFEAKYGCPVHYIPNGVNVPSLTPPELIREQYGLLGRDYILYLGRLVPEKRIDWLIEAFCRTSSPLRLVIAGDDQDAPGHTRYLQERIAGDRRAVFTGTVGGQLKEELLSNALFYATASSVEGLPIAVLEAMAHSRCCLASDIPPHREIIEPGRDGLLFAQDSADMLAAALEDLIKRSNDYRRRLGQEARRKVSRQYTWESVADAVEALYTRLLVGSGAGTRQEGES